MVYVPKSPFIISVQLTTKCNLNCKHCLADADFNVWHSLTREVLFDIIDEAENSGAQVLDFGGGEPLLYEHFFESLEYAFSKNIRVSAVTNGTLVKKHYSQFKKIKDEYKHLFYPAVSLDGHTPELHSYFRPIETFDSAIEGIELFHEAGFSVSSLCVLNKENQELISEYVDFISKMNVSHARFLPLMPFGRGKSFENEMLNRNEIKKIISMKVAGKLGNDIKIGFQMPWEFLFDKNNMNAAPCEAAYTRLWISADGSMYPCSFMPDVIIGNVYRDKITDVWCNSKILNDLRNPNLLKGKCGNCIYRDECRGGCRGIAYYREGDYLCSDPSCPIEDQSKICQM